MAVADAFAELREIGWNKHPIDNQEIIAAGIGFHEWNNPIGRRHSFRHRVLRSGGMEVGWLDFITAKLGRRWPCGRQVNAADYRPERESGRSWLWAARKHESQPAAPDSSVRLGPASWLKPGRRRRRLRTRRIVPDLPAPAPRVPRNRSAVSRCDGCPH